MPPLTSWPELDHPLERRRFLQLMGASMALAGLGACTRLPLEKILPAVSSGSAEAPDRPLLFSSVSPLGGDARGILVKSFDGRPVKIDGNPRHPSSLGGSDVFLQAELLALYDPDRLKTPLHRGHASTWDAFVAELAVLAPRWRRQKGAGLRVLTGEVRSPTLLGELRSLLALYPEARWHAHEPISLENAEQGAQVAFGTACRPLYRLARAELIVSLDADFLFAEPGSLALSRQFSDARRIREGRREMSRLLVAECSVSITGAMADARWALTPAELTELARALGGELGVAPKPPAATAAPPTAAAAATIARELTRHRGKSVVLVGRHQPPALHALAHAINEKLGNLGRTVELLPAFALPTQPGSLGELTSALRDGHVESLLIIGCNPAYDAPAELGFADALKKAPWKTKLGLHSDETAALCDWQIPESHFLEAWGDAASHDGTVSIQQPLIAPLHESKTALEVLSALRSELTQTPHQRVQARWGQDARRWEEALRSGVAAEAGPPLHPPKVDLSKVSAQLAALPGGGGPALSLVFRPDPSVWDGRYANNAWLQELPRPLSKLTWDNALIIGQATARRLSLGDGDVVEVKRGERRLEAPVLVDERHPEGSATAPLGYGRARAGAVGNGVGFNAYLLRSSDALDSATGIELRKTGRRYVLARTQHHHEMESPEPARSGTLAQYRRDPRSIVPAKKPQPSLIPETPPLPPSSGEAWGMVIDLNVCIGCNACTIACQAENNIPVVGRAEVLKNREMHWIRVDRYVKGEQALFQPVPCMHCEKAPCEVVCPTAATNHSPDGLNQMVYNRCVGTRYCSNNCPYKVRRFNFFQYAAPGLTKLGANPEVTIRSRGVMEKCTYCVQRIEAGTIAARVDGRALKDGNVRTACQDACPTRAIVFGNLRDAGAEVSRLKREPHEYALLEETGTRPRTTYLARLRKEES